MSTISTKYEPNRTQGLATDTPEGRMFVEDVIDEVDIFSCCSLKPQVNAAAERVSTSKTAEGYYPPIT